MFAEKVNFRSKKTRDYFRWVEQASLGYFGRELNLIGSPYSKRLFSVRIAQIWKENLRYIERKVLSLFKEVCTFKEKITYQRIENRFEETFPLVRAQLRKRIQLLHDEAEIADEYHWRMSEFWLRPRPRKLQ
jgi:hypothetical protein